MRRTQDCIVSLGGREVEEETHFFSSLSDCLTKGWQEVGELKGGWQEGKKGWQEERKGWKVADVGREENEEDWHKDNEWWQDELLDNDLEWPGWELTGSLYGVSSEGLSGQHGDIIEGLACQHGDSSEGLSGQHGDIIEHLACQHSDNIESLSGQYSDGSEGFFDQNSDISEVLSDHYGDSSEFLSGQHMDSIDSSRLLPGLCHEHSQLASCMDNSDLEDPPVFQPMELSNICICPSDEPPLRQQVVSHERRTPDVGPHISAGRCGVGEDQVRPKLKGNKNRSDDRDRKRDGGCGRNGDGGQRSLKWTFD